MDKITYLIDLYNKPEILLNFTNLYQDKSQSNLRGNIFEKYAKIVMLFGYYKDYQLLDENYKIISTDNTEDAEKQRINYLKTHKIIDSCAEGIFDIKLMDKYTYKRLFLSCKYYSKEKTIDHYDILEMAENVKDNNTQIGLCIKNKNEFKDRVKLSRNNTIKKYINFDNIIDYSDIKEMFIKLINNKGVNKVNDLNIFDVSICNQELIKQITKNNIILDCILINQIIFIQSVILSKHCNNILILTTDKIMQLNWKKEYFDKYYDFDFYNISFDIKNINDNKNITIIDYNIFQDNYKLFKNYQLIFLDNIEYYNKNIFNKINYDYLVIFSLNNNKLNDNNMNIIKYTTNINKINM